MPKSVSFGTTTFITLRRTPACNTAILRPDGTPDGITALLNDVNGCIDYARSSSAKPPTGADNLLFIAYVRDGVTRSTFSTATGSPVKTSTNITTVQLTGIFNCTITD